MMDATKVDENSLAQSPNDDTHPVNEPQTPEPIGNTGADGTNTETDEVEIIPRMIGTYVEKFLIDRAKDMMERRTKTWEIARLHALDRIPRLKASEIELGKELGKGGFFTVIEIKDITLQEEDEDETDPHEESLRDDYDDDFTGVVQNRRFMERNCIRKGNHPRYCFKTMQDHCKEDPETFVSTMVDLGIEAAFLANVRHPNIIKMRAMSDGFISSGDDFIVLDKLYGTLEAKILEWKDADKNSFAKLFDFRGKYEKAFLAERLTVAYDVGSALSYLHDRNIIYRDLKPANIGFDVRKDAKLFDFGLAIEFDCEKHDKFKMTGDTGTTRYMAPEVALHQPYTAKADVYSFGILLWQILSLEDPYGKMTEARIEYSVANLGLRPKINPSWSNALCLLLQDCFADPKRRPPMEVACSVLRREVNSLGGKKLMDEDLMDSSRSAMSARDLSARYYDD